MLAFVLIADKVEEVQPAAGWAIGDLGRRVAGDADEVMAVGGVGDELELFLVVQVRRLGAVAELPGARVEEADAPAAVTQGEGAAVRREGQGGAVTADAPAVT